LASLARRLAKAARGHLLEQRTQFTDRRLRLERHAPRPRLLSEKERLKFTQSTLSTALKNRLETERRRTQHFAAMLHQLSPLSVMARGYALTFDGQGRVIRQAAETKVGDEVSIRLLPPDVPGEPTLQDAEEILARVTSVKGLARKGKLS
jgi:exodeoxyribonuclease VII large subunit